jgi:hypothetical protein
MLQRLIAIELEQPALLFESLAAVGAISPARDPEEIERSLARFMAVHLGPVLADGQTRLVEVIGWLGLFAGTVLLMQVLLEVPRSQYRDP